MLGLLKCNNVGHVDQRSVERLFQRAYGTCALPAVAQERQLLRHLPSARSHEKLSVLIDALKWLKS